MECAGEKPLADINRKIGITMSKAVKAAAVEECNSESHEEVRINMRRQLNNDVESFLLNGGSVQQVENNVRADPPKKPSMSYGTAPI
ncbi:MAG: hypothetical protein ACJAWS_002318 [Oleiphilaceae bacterium]|jgi:hypothetical protein